MRFNMLLQNHPTLKKINRSDSFCFDTQAFLIYALNCKAVVVMHKSVFCYNKPISEALNKICPTSATDHTTGII